jgi:D-arginine dehydrogenase
MAQDAPADWDVIVVGGGIAGSSIGFRLAPDRRVLVLERESAPGYHSTGRSAAGLSENLGTRVVRALTTLGRPFMEAPPPGFTGAPLMRPRLWLFIARADQADDYARELAEARESAPSVHEVSREEALRRFPLLDPAYVARAFVEPTATDLDVDAILQGYLKGLRAAGGRLVSDAEVLAIARNGDRWIVETRAGTFRAAVVVNAAGAWAEHVAALAGVRPIGLVPKRRTAIIVPAPEGTDPSAWPELDDVGGEFYVKPEAGKFLVSPSDETPSEPTDAQPDDLDVALAVDRLERATTLRVKRVEHRWAGLRSFVADREPVVGFDAQAPGFFWLAGQGGAGIQTSPGLSETAAGLILGRPWPGLLSRRGIEARHLSPERLARGTPASRIPA